MSSGKPNFLSQPIVKNVFMYRNGDPYYDARRIVVNQKRVANFDTLLREVTGGIQAPFGAVRNIYTPRGGHKVDCLESLQSGEQYVAAGRERFKRLDYLQIGSRRKKMMQTLPLQAKPLPPNRIIVSARFLKPIKEPCTIFVVSNGDVLNPAMRLLIHQRMLSQFERILELITEKMGLRVFGGVRSLYTYEGHPISDGNQLECGQLYVAVGRERFKKLPYSDLLFTKPRGTRRVNGMKAYSLPPIYRFSKQNGNQSKSMVRCIDSGDSESKAAPLSHTGSKDRLSAIVREISQARLLSISKTSSGQSISNNGNAEEDLEPKNEDGDTEAETLQNQPAEEVETYSPIPADDATKAAEENGEIAADGEEDVAKHTTEEEPSANKDEIKGNQEDIGKKEEGEDKDGNTEQNAEKYGAAAGAEEVEEEVKKQQQEVVANESNSEVKCEETGSTSSHSDKIQYSDEKDDGGQTSCEGETYERDKRMEEETRDKDSEKGERSSEDQVNDEDTGNDQKETENRSGRTHSDNETEENDSGRYQHEDVSNTKEEAATKESEEAKKEVNGEVSGEDDGVLSGTELDNEEISDKDAERNGEKRLGYDEDSQKKHLVG